MRFGVDATCWSNRRGYGRFTRGVARALVAAAPPEEIVLYADADTAELIDVSRARVRRVQVGTPPAAAASAGSRRSVLDLVRFARAVARDRPDAFLFPSLLTYVPVRRVPLVVGLHDAIPHELAEHAIPGRRARVLWRLKEHDAIGRAASLFTVSEASRVALGRALSIPAERLAIVPEAPDPVFVPNPPAPAPLPADLGTAPFVLCAAGGVSPHKNVGTMLDAFALLPDGATPSLVVVGALEDETYASSSADVRRRLDTRGLNDRVVLTGFVPDDVLATLYREALVVVNPSRAEGYGLPAVEAAACGAPLLLSDVPAHRELFDEAAAFVDPASAEAIAACLGELLAQPELRAGIAARCRAVAERLTWDAAADRLLPLLREAAARG